MKFSIMLPFPGILLVTALCLEAAGLSSCQQTKEVPYGEEMLPIDDGEMPIFDYFP